MTPRTYASPEAFKQALEQRLRSSAKTGAEFARKGQPGTTPISVAHSAVPSNEMARSFEPATT